VAFETLGIDRLLIEVAEHEEVDRLLQRVLQPLLAYDQRYGTALLRSLECYLARNGGLQLAARDLAVHPHTLRYRLDRVRQLTGIDVTDSEARLEAQLALRLGKLRVIERQELSP
jgi:DNA-binding PucR family transcriptional regulator